MSVEPTLIELLEHFAQVETLTGETCALIARTLDRDRHFLNAERLAAAAARLRSEMAALEIRSKDKRDPMTDHAFCSLNALRRVNGGNNHE